MAEADTRDAEAVIAEIEAEFRMACKAARKFMAFYGAEDTPRGLRNGSPDMWSGSRRVNLLRPVIVASVQSFPGKWVDCISFSCRSRENLAARILWSGIKPRDLGLSEPIGGFVKKARRILGMIIRPRLAYIRHRRGLTAGEGKHPQ
jgi:hypothetical protein